MNITKIQGKDYPFLNYQNISMFIPSLKTMLEELNGFTEHLQIALEDAVRETLDYFDSKKLAIDIYLLNDMIRFHTKLVMKEKANLKLFEDYNVDDKVANNGLACRYQSYFIKVFKERKDRALIPNSEPKEAFFCQQLSFDDSSGFNLKLSKRPNVFYMWNLDRDYLLMPLRLVCPRYGIKNKSVTQVYYDEVLPIISGGLDNQMRKTEDDELNYTKKEIKVNNSKEEINKK